MHIGQLFTYMCIKYMFTHALSDAAFSHSLRTEQGQRIECALSSDLCSLTGTCTSGMPCLVGMFSVNTTCHMHLPLLMPSFLPPLSFSFSLPLPPSSLVSLLSFQVLRYRLCSTVSRSPDLHTSIYLETSRHLLQIMNTKYKNLQVRESEGVSEWVGVWVCDSVCVVML